MKRFSGVLACILVIALCGCDYIIPHTWRYKITVAIETPEGIKSGSTVRQVVSRLLIPITPESQTISHVITGEAVVIDLDEMGVVFSLINSDSYNELYQAFPRQFSDVKQRLEYYSGLENGARALLKKDLPWFATFTDPSDAMSLTGINPRSLNQFYGDGYKLHGITIEITDEAISSGNVDNYLPKNFQQKIISGWQQLTLKQRDKFYKLARFKKG